MTKLYQGFTTLSLALLLIGISSCQGTQSKQTDTDKYSDKIVGKWRYSEVDGGVTCIVTFEANKRMNQYFKAEDGHDKLRPGTWDIKGDTIIVSDQTGPTELTIETLNDSVLSLHTLDSFPVYFYRIKE